MNITRNEEYQFFSVGTKICNCYVVTYKDKAVMFDTGPLSERATIEANLQKDFIFDLDAIFLTHSHGDSAGNAEYFSMLFNCPVYCIKTAVDLVSRGRVVIPPKSHPYMKKVGNAARLMLKMPSFIPYEACQNVKPLTSSIVEELLGRKAQLLMTPGHTDDSISFAFENVAIIGDCAQFKKRVLAPIFVNDENQLASSWESLLRLGCKYYLCSHGRPFDADEWLHQKVDASASESDMPDMPDMESTEDTDNA